MPFIPVVDVRSLRGEERKTVIYVGRACYGWPKHPLHNPYKMPPYGTGLTAMPVLPEQREKVEANIIVAYTALIELPELQADFEALVAEVKATRKPLGCWCGNWDGTGEPQFRCHAVVLSKKIGELDEEST